MRVELSDEQAFLREAVAGAVDREAAPSAVRDWTRDGDFGPADALAERQGWTGIGVPEELDGQGGGVLELAVLAEQLGRGAVPWDRTLAGCLAAGLLAEAGEDEARALASATATGGGAVLAADGRRPLAALPAGDAEHVTLSVGYVVGGAHASEFVLPFAAGEDEVELLAIAADAPGVGVRARTLVDRTRALADLELDGAAPRRAGRVTRAALRATASAAAVIVAADALGAAARMLELTVSYVAERRQFGVPVGSFQAVKHAAAEMLVDVEAARSAVHHGAWAVGARTADAHVHAAIAKAIACRGAVRVADKALFLHGAVGYTWEHDLQFPFKRAKSDVLLFGSPDAHLDAIASELDLLPS